MFIMKFGEKLLKIGAVNQTYDPKDKQDKRREVCLLRCGIIGGGYVNRSIPKALRWCLY